MRGARVEPGIYRRPGGGYLLRLVRHGQEFTRVLDRLEDARLLKRQRMLAKAGMILPGPRVSLKAILDAYADELEAQGSNDAPRLRRLMKRITDFFGEHRPAPLEKEDLLPFRKWVLEETDSRGDLYRRACVVIRTAHKRAGLPRPDAPPIRLERRGRRVLSPADTRALIAAMPWGSPERAIAEIMVLTAGRLREVLRLQARDIEGSTLKIRSFKGPTAAWVLVRDHPITPRLQAVLSSVLPPDAKPDRLVVLLDGRPPLGEASFRKRLLRASERAEIVPPIGGFAWLRNAALTALVEGGAPIEVVSRIAGHASVKTTERHYDRAVLWKERIAAAGLLAETLGAATPPEEPENSKGAPENDRK
jgi:integrase